MATLREECSLPSVRHRIFARASIAMVSYTRRWIDSPLTEQYDQAPYRPSLDPHGRDLLKAIANAIRSLEVNELVRCGPDLLSTIYYPEQLPFSPPRCHATFALKVLIPALIQQRSPYLATSSSTPTALLYYTDGSANTNGSSGTAFVTGITTVARRLQPHTIAFQAEHAAVLPALHQA